MNLRVLFLLLALCSLLPAWSQTNRTPITRGYLTTPLNANQKAITNVSDILDENGVSLLGGGGGGSHVNPTNLPGTGIVIATNNANSHTFLVNTNTVATRDWSTASINNTSNGLRAGNLVFLLTFDQTNGVGSNVVAAATPRVGRFLHATREAGNPPNSLVPMITNRSLTYQPISNAGTIYLGYSAVGPIQRVKMVFRMRETYGNGAAVSPYVHLVGNGEFVAASDIFAHGGFSPQVGVVAFDGHLGGFGGQPSAQPTVAVTNVDTVFWPLQEGLGRLNTFEYWRTGTNVVGHVNGWPFILPYTNALAFTNQTNLIVQFFANSQNALSGRNPEIVSIAAWDSPYPSVDNEALPDGMVNPVFYGATVYRNLTNAPGSRIQGAGSNSIERITTLQATNAAVVAQTNDSLRVVGPILLGQPGGPVIQTITGTNSMLVFGENRASLTNVESITGQGEQHAIDTGGVMFESGPTVNSQAEFILFANGNSNLLLRALAAQTSPQLQLGNVGLLAGSVTFTNLTVLNGGSVSGVISGSGLSTITNFTAGSFSNGVTVGGTAGLFSGTAFRHVQFSTSGTAVSSGGGTFINVHGTSAGGIQIDGGGVVTRITSGGGLNVSGNSTNSGSGTFTNGVYYTSNSLTATAVLSGLTNGGTWVGMISNGLHAAYMSNGVTFWTLITTNR